jgi:hypothetical protein
MMTHNIAACSRTRWLPGLAGPTKTGAAQGDTNQSVGSAPCVNRKNAAKPVKTLTNDDLPVATVAAATRRSE